VAERAVGSGGEGGGASCGRESLVQKCYRMNFGSRLEPVQVSRSKRYGAAGAACAPCWCIEANRRILRCPVFKLCHSHARPVSLKSIHACRHGDKSLQHSAWLWRLSTVGGRGLAWPWAERLTGPTGRLPGFLLYLVERAEALCGARYIPGPGTATGTGTSTETGKPGKPVGGGQATFGSQKLAAWRRRLHLWMRS